MEEKINKIKEILKRLDLCIDEKVIFIYLISFSKDNIIKISRCEILGDFKFNAWDELFDFKNRSSRK